MKKGLVLEGGGTKGAYQIGAYKALRDLGIKFTGIAGTSIGALNGALIIQDDDKVMEDIWINYDYKSFMNIDEDTYERYKNIEMKAKNFHDVVDLINKARKNNGIDISPLRKLLQEKIDEDKIRQSNIDFGITTAYWDGKIFPKLLYTEDIPKGRLADYLIASASLPIFQLDKLDDKLYLDGMFSDNIPINMLAQKGYNDIVVIRLVNDSIGKKIINKYKDLNLKLIVPSQDLGGSLNKDKEHIETNVKLGYLDTMKAYKRYDGVKYFFNLDCKYNEDYCFNKISNLNLDTINDLCYLLNIKKDINRRTLMENIIPKIVEILDIDKNSSYKDIFYSVYERKLEENNINRIELYDFNKVIQICNKQMTDDKLQINHSGSKLVKIVTNLIIYDFNKQK
ncbi:MAG: patatin-like phospholipase family protein [Clostridiales bacterium]|uniref:patatin-like phospholipase family protein n=1 Tax=Terrisporobacter sp. TaxID=1965305 RepID=UPI002A46605B|nr:patatin-like phospholipase family protein [Terrisporobacter sp.]MCI5629991.1 patatin-like phospholipase family protein [Clostridium sp.]MDD5878207.1 patatin-like phospholipase family protein [Clostridiales bacterium]MCI6456800.1 patatin-like phospholipase family protein [Clostridium sp.]MCI7205826.1 patatin-like phospholipase family protein [Clostridium sp.]MDD7754797.1 patatin-like phospholipase family protein [Clostridiales bacterium]